MTDSEVLISIARNDLEELLQKAICELLQPLTDELSSTSTSLQPPP